MQDLLDKTVAAGAETVILCAGMAARPMVHRLVGRGFLAYDLGHFGQWFVEGRPIPLAECPR